jgi:feruloyl esterase
MDHCSGGDGAFAIDWLTPLENWVEKDEPPGALPAAHPVGVPGLPGSPPSPGKPFTRPVCAYPLVAKYKGSGDDSLATNFDCVSP